ncbi:MAG: hypothetical protein E6G39_03340 [Actinobacteria bacterium]|nr:MAG: hypothetical protein E6G39_03340 [Actinomycetota bacterium]
MRVRITAVATLVVAAAITLAGVFLVQAIEQKLLGTVRTQGQAQLDAASAQLGKGVPPDQLHTVAGSAPSFVQILDSEGTPTYPWVGTAPYLSMCKQASCRLRRDKRSPWT